MKFGKMKKIFVVALLVAVGVFNQGCGDKKQAPDVVNTVEEEPQVEAEDLKDEKEAEVEEEPEAEVEVVKVETKRVGDGEHGFVDIPADWISYKEINEGALDTQYSNPEGTSIITLFANKEAGEALREAADTAYEIAQAEDPESMEMRKGELAGFEAFYLKVNFRDAGDQYMWLLEAEEGAIYSVTMNGNRGELDDLVEIVENSYSVDQ